MPIGDFHGRFGWGYDGVNLWAPTRLYGRPDDFRRFVDRAHALGLGVILDVVYNHLGPSGNYLRAFAPAYFSQRYDNEWGDAINFDGADAAPVREYFTANAGYWIDEFHLDGLRLDATQQIFDSSADHILRVIGARVRDAARGRSTIVVAENEPQDTRLVRPVAEGRIRTGRLVERRFSPQRDGRADRPRRGVLHGHARRAAGVRLGREIRVPVPGAALQLAAAAAGHASAGVSAPPSSSTFCRTTIRWPTPPADCAGPR